MKIKPILLFSAFALVGAANADLLSYYNFNDSEVNSAHPDELFSADGGSLKSKTTLSTTTPYNFYYTQNGTTTNGVAGEVAGSSFQVQGGPNFSGALTLSTTSNGGTVLSGLNYSFAGLRTSIGFNSYQLAYSVNGSSFTNFGSTFDVNVGSSPFGFGPTPDPTAIRAFNLSSIGSNIHTVSVRLTYSGATNPYNSRLFLDNIKLTGNVQALPEPSTWAALGLGSVALLRRRRKA